MGRAPRIVATHREIIDVHAKLQDVLLQDGDAVRYQDGWNDDRVQTEAAPRLTSGHVARIRNDMFGRLSKPEDAEKGYPVLALMVLELRKTVEDLTRRVAMLESVPTLFNGSNKLEMGRAS